MPSRLATAHRLTATLRCLLCLGAMLFGAAVPALALASVPELVRPARDQFDFGRYREAIRSVDELIGQKVLTTEAELTEAWRIHGLARLYLGQRAEARASFENLLALDPDFALDPLLVPPMAIEALDEVREAKREFLEPIRARRRQLAEERARAEAETRATLARQPMMIQRIERHSFFANFLPLGAAQLSQQRGRVGVLFAIGQSLAVAGTIFSWTQVDSKIEADGKVRPENLDSARAWRMANWVMFGATIALYLGGVVDAVAHYEEETVTEFEMQRPPAQGGASAPEAPRQVLFIAPVEGGAAAGVAGTF